MSLEVSGDLINEGQLFLDLSKQIVSFMSKSRPQAGVADRAFSSHMLVLSKVATCASYTEPHSKKACKMRVWFKPIDSPSTCSSFVLRCGPIITLYFLLLAAGHLLTSQIF